MGKKWVSVQWFVSPKKKKSDIQTSVGELVCEKISVMLYVCETLHTGPNLTSKCAAMKKKKKNITALSHPVICANTVARFGK